MICASFNSTESFVTAYGLWQYNYGQKLRIQGLVLPTAVEIHFSLQETGGESVTRVGVTKDGVTDVVIPDSMLENDGANRDYKVYAFVYLADSESGETIRKIIMPVKSRPKPEAFDTPEDAELFREAIAAVNEVADRAEKAAKTATEQVEGFNEYVADKVTEAENQITKAKDDAVNEVSADIKKATDAANTAVNAATSAENAKNEAVQAIQTEVDTQIQAVNSAGEEALKTIQTEQNAVIRIAQEQIQNIEGTAAEKVTEIEKKGTEVLDSIPENYAQLQNDVTANSEQMRTRSSAIVQTASGTAIVAQDSSDDPVRGLRVFGRTIQDGTPTPDAPVPLVSVGDGGSVEVGVFGKNLLNVKDLILGSNTSLSVSDDGYEITAVGGGDSTYACSIIELDAKYLRGKTLYIRADSITESIASSVAYVQFICTKSDGSNVYIGIISTKKLYETVEFQPDIVKIILCVYSNNSKTLLGADVTAVVKGLRVTLEPDAEWEPYKESRFLTLQTPNGLPGIPVTNASLANYTDADGQMWCSDEVDLERGVYVQRVKEIVMNGGFTLSSKGNFRRKLEPIGFNIDQRTQSSLVAVLCSHYKCNTWVYVNTNRNDGCALEYGGLAINILDSSYTSLDDFNAYVAENPITALYILATPIETPLTESELAAYQSLRSNYPVTTVLSSDNAYMEFNYNADPKNYIAAEHAKMEAAFDAKLAEIIALLPAETQAAMIENETTNLLNESEE